MRTRGEKDETEYRAKVITDTGGTRGRVPSPLLKAMGARPGDFMIFRLSETGEAVMRLSRSKGNKRAAVSQSKRAQRRGR
jgi:uncharacterized protein (DUF2249 family)